MARARYEHEVDAEGLADLLQPRDDVLLEQRVGSHEFTVAEGPFRSYRRRVTVVPDGAEPAGGGTDRFHVVEDIEFRVAIPVFGFLFVPALKATLRHRGRDTRPWWSPPDRFDARASTVLGLLCGLSVVAAYLGTLLSQTITFAADEFGASDAEQGVALAAVRASVIATLFLIALADRQGRRRMLVLSLVLACVATATTAFAPNLSAFTVSQALARGFSTTAIVLLSIIAVEEMPGGSRAYAISVITVSGALGAGMVLWFLPLADLGTQGWRILFLIPLPMLFGVRVLGRALPESKRFLQAAQTDLDDRASHEPAARRSHRRRLLLLASSGLLASLFFAPASQFMNDYLRDDRGFSAARITLFQITTNLPGGLGIVVGGKLADVRGRRMVGAIGLVVGVGATVVMYNVSGVSMWLWSVVGALFGAAVIPALGVYGPELFPTNLRGRANSVITLLGVAGSVVGLLVVGALSDRWGGFGSAIFLAAVGPAILALLVVAFYPETAHRELEEINPEDAVIRDLPLPPMFDEATGLPPGRDRDPGRRR